MALGIGHLLTAISIGQLVLGVGYLPDITAPDLLQHGGQREEQQSWETIWPLKEMQQSSQEPRKLAQQGVLLAAWQHWWFWACAESLLVLFGLYWLPRSRSADSDSSSQQGSSSSEEEGKEEDDWEDKPDPLDALGRDKPHDQLRTSSAFARLFPRTTF